MRSLVLFAVLGFCHAASIEERFLPLFSSDAVAPETPAKAESAASSRPVVAGPGSGGKKIQITIIKEIDKGGHGGQVANHQPNEMNHPGHADAHAATNATAHAGAHEHGAHVPAPAHAPVPAAAPRLELNNQLQIDNATMQQMLQQLLSGNVQAMQATGHPAVGHDANKPVAVIFSSALHVVDLGELVPPQPATPAPAVAAHDGHGAVNATHEAHGHGAANATHAPHAEHPGLNATGLLDSIFKPLLSLTHMGHTTHQVAPPVPQMPVMQPQMQMQPVIMMVPTAQLPFAQQPVMVSSQAQVDSVLQSILSAKEQLLSQSMAQTQSASASSAHTAPAHSSPAVAPVHSTPVAQPSTHAQAESHASGHGTPVASFPLQKKKSFGVVITKDVSGARRALD